MPAPKSQEWKIETGGLDASGDTELTPNEAISFERHDHLVDRGRADLTVALHIGLGGGEPVKVGTRLKEWAGHIALFRGSPVTEDVRHRRLFLSSSVSH